MSWVSLALGLIREAATTELGREIISDLRSNTARKRKETQTDAEQIADWRRSVDERIAIVDRNIEMLVEMLNAQDAMLVKIQKRQRVWNLALATVGLVALVSVTLLLIR